MLSPDDPTTTAMPLDGTALLASGTRHLNGNVNDRASRHWGGDKPEHTVDVQRLAETKSKHPDLTIASCCDRYAARVLGQCCGCCCLLVVLPCIGLSMLDNASGIAFWLLAGLSAVLLLVGIALCCTCFCPVLAVGISPPQPADCVAPLVEREANNTHQTKPVKRVALVYNPNAGKGKAGELLHDVVIPNLQSHGVQVDEIPTQRVNHAREIGFTTDLSELDGLVVMGGDGTVHELVNGILARKDVPEDSIPPVGLLPFGSGNALASDFRQNQLRRGIEVSVYKELETVTDWALDRITEGHSCRVDVLGVTAQGQRVASAAVVLFGLLADIDVLAEPLRWMGPGRFDVAGIWGMLKRCPMPPCRIEARCRDRSVRVLTNIESEGGTPWLGFALDLGQHWSDTIRASPTSQLDDGVAELHILKVGPSRTELLKGFNLMATGAHLTMPQSENVIETFAFTELSIDFSENGHGHKGVYNVDGEMFWHDGHIDVEVCPRRLRVFCDPFEECHQEMDAHRTTSRMMFKAYPQRWTNMIIFMLCTFVNQMVWITFASIAVLTADAFRVSTFYVNMLSLIFMMVYIPCNFLATYFIDRIGCRSAVVLGSFLTMLGAGLRVVAGYMPLPSDQERFDWKPVVLLLGQALAAFGQPFLTNMPPKIAHVWFPSHQRVIADTLCSLCGPVGAAIGFLLPPMITNGQADMMSQLLLVTSLLCILPFVLALTSFKDKPPTPPSASAATSTADHSRKGVLAESWDAVCDRDFLALLVAFSAGNGTFNVLATLVEQLVAPFGFSEDDASNIGADVIVAGLVGAALCTAMLGYTHNFQGTLFGCFIGALAAIVILSIIVPLGTQAFGIYPAVYLFHGLLGLFMTPVMPIAFETSVELMFPDVGEAVLSGLCMTGGQVIGITMTLVLQALLTAGWARAAWWLLTFGSFLGAVAISFLRKKSVGARRRQCEALQRKSGRLEQEFARSP